jgi:hypothetical protein
MSQHDDLYRGYRQEVVNNARLLAHDIEIHISILEHKNSELQAKVEWLKCCGNCGHWSDFDLCAEGGHDNYRGGDKCHFTPSRWTARADEGSES